MLLTIHTKWFKILVHTYNDYHCFLLLDAELKMLSHQKPSKETQFIIHIQSGYTKRTPQLHVKQCLEGFRCHPPQNGFYSQKSSGTHPDFGQFLRAWHDIEKRCLSFHKKFIFIPTSGQALEELLYLIPRNESGSHLGYIHSVEGSPYTVLSLSASRALKNVLPHLGMHGFRKVQSRDIRI